MPVLDDSKLMSGIWIRDGHHFLHTPGFDCQSSLFLIPGLLPEFFPHRTYIVCLYLFDPNSQKSRLITTFSPHRTSIVCLIWSDNFCRDCSPTSLSTGLRLLVEKCASPDFSGSRQTLSISDFRLLVCSKRSPMWRENQESARSSLPSQLAVLVLMVLVLIASVL